jgi:MtN3 and saliva related transmembrane protein
MSTSTLVFICGTVGGFCTTFAFVPQVVKIWRQGGRDLSYGMLSLYLFGVSLWLVYGILIHAMAIALTNAATFVLIAIATGLKVWKERRDAPRETIGVAAAEAVE